MDMLNYHRVATFLWIVESTVIKTVPFQSFPRQESNRTPEIEVDEMGKHGGFRHRFRGFQSKANIAVWLDFPLPNDAG